MFWYTGMEVSQKLVETKNEYNEISVRVEVEFCATLVDEVVIWSVMVGLLEAVINVLNPSCIITV